MRSADPASRELLASVDASRWEVLWRLRLPSALPSLFTAAKYNTGLALIVAYLVEGGTGGLGEIGARASRRQPGRPIVGRDLLDGDPRHDLPGAALPAAARGAAVACVAAAAGRVERIRCRRWPTSMTSAARIDQLDGALIAIVAERLAVCREVAAVKEHSDTPVIQPAPRARRRRRPAGSRPSRPGSTPTSPSSCSACCSPRPIASRWPATVPTRRPTSRPPAGESRAARHRGHPRRPRRRRGPRPRPAAAALAVRGSVSTRCRWPATPRPESPLAAGGVTFVLVGPRGVAQRRRLPGAQRRGRAARRDRGAQRRVRPRRASPTPGAPLLTEVVVDADGHEQFFAVDDPATGVQLGLHLPHRPPRRRRRGQRAGALRRPRTTSP